MSAETLRPDGVGDEENITTADPDVDHHLNVDESEPDGDTTYVQTTSATYLRDLYTLADSGVGAGAINKITVYAVAIGVTGVDQPSLKIAVKSGETVSEAEKTVTLSWASYSQEWALNPDDSEAWEWADIDALQIGVALRRCLGGLAKATRCTQVYAVVDYGTDAEVIVPLADTVNGATLVPTFVRDMKPDIPLATTINGATLVPTMVRDRIFDIPLAGSISITDFAPTLNLGVTVTVPLATIAIEALLLDKLIASIGVISKSPLSSSYGSPIAKSPVSGEYSGVAKKSVLDDEYDTPQIRSGFPSNYPDV